LDYINTFHNPFFSLKKFGIKENETIKKPQHQIFNSQPKWKYGIVNKSAI